MTIKRGLFLWMIFCSLCVSTPAFATSTSTSMTGIGGGSTSTSGINATLSTTSETTPSTDYSSTTSESVQDDGVTLTNTGSLAVNVYAQLGTVPSPLTAVQNQGTSLAKDDVEAYAATGSDASPLGIQNYGVALPSATSTTELPTAASTTGTLTYSVVDAGASTPLTVAFYFGAGTPPNTYVIPITYTVS